MNTEDEPELHIEEPLIGPFAEPNGLSGDTELGRHLGVAISWSSASGVVKFNLLESHDSGWFRRKTIIEELPHEDFDLILDELFECSSRLFEFFEELGPFVHFGNYSLVSARAKEWLNPDLVSKGFSLGQARAHRSGVTTPLLWVVRTADQRRCLGVPCVRADYLEWTPGGVSLRGRSWWGLGSICLSRYLDRFLANPSYRWLTEAGHTRMQEVFARGNKRRADKKSEARTPERFSHSDKTIMATLRRQLRGLASPTAAQLQAARHLGERAYSALLRGLVAKHADAYCAALLRSRLPRQADRDKLLQLIVENKMYQSTRTCVEKIDLSSNRDDLNKKSALFSAAIEASDLQMLEALLDSASHIRVDDLAWAFDRALETNYEEALQLLAASPKLSGVLQPAMLASFRSQYFGQNWTAAMRLLDLGLRPLQASAADDWFSSMFLTEGSLPVLERMFQLEPPSERNIQMLLRHPWGRGGCELDLVIRLSRTISRHQERMSELAFWCVIGFMHGDGKRALDHLLQAIREGGTLVVFEEELLEREFLHGNKWRERRNRLIDLISSLRRAGLTAEVAVLARIKRGGRTESKPES
ncbi:MAG: hypothetical protein ABSH14_07520 [Verrucomicrobiia bacterium]|jgi:hypothetical protein